MRDDGLDAWVCELIEVLPFPATMFRGGDAESGAHAIELADVIRGLRRGVLQVLDHRVRVPMAGRVASLNVAAAAAVLLFEFRRRSDLATPA